MAEKISRIESLMMARTNTATAESFGFGPHKARGSFHDQVEGGGGAQSATCIMTSEVVPRTAGGMNPPETIAITRVPPSHGVHLRPRLRQATAAVGDGLRRVGVE